MNIRDGEVVAMRGTMGDGIRPTTLEGDWDRFYLEFPDVYDRFASFSVEDVAVLDELFGLAGKVVVNCGRC
jgi:hypothetical protein